MRWDTAALATADKAHLWHPFTQMRDWCAVDHTPLVLVEGRGAILRDSEGREYIDGNSSIWTNLHGHHHPRIDAAIRTQLESLAHTSFLGFTNPPAIQLAEELLELFRLPHDEEHPPLSAGRLDVNGHKQPEPLSRVFYSDNGSTAIEVAIKMAAQYWQLKGASRRQRFVAFTNAYHGDTMGASSLGGVRTFHERFAAWQFPVTHVASVDALLNPDSQGGNQSPLIPEEIAAVVLEPLIQGAAGMRLWPRGMLAQLRHWCDENDVLLILDEVMTGFGRTGTMFACQQEHVIPDFIALAKGLTGGYMPLAATLTTEQVFETFLGSVEEQKTLYYGHTYTGHPLGCAAALANLAIFREEKTLTRLQSKISLLTELLTRFAECPHVADIRQCGFIAGIELMRDGITPFPPESQTGQQVCLAARKHGLLTRPIRDVIVLMPPYCITDSQLDQAVQAIEKAIREVCR